MRVSVIASVYNGAAFVAEAIESVLAQTHRDRQVIVVDDGSTDATPAVLARFGACITVVRRTNGGTSAARNDGLARADGECVAFIDCDDVWEPMFLERGLGELGQSDPGVAGAVAGWVRVDRDGRELPGTRIVPRADIGLRDLIVGNRFGPGAALLRRRAVLDLGGFDTALRATEDWDLWLRLALAGWRFVAIGECLWRYRLHEQNLSNDPDRVRDGALRTLEKLFAHPALPADLHACRSRAVGNAYLHASEPLYALGRDAAAARDFIAAVATCPALLEDDETYYAIVCADQPAGFKASALHLDLLRGQQYILHALAACRERGTIGAAAHRRALGRAYRTLAALAYGQRRMRDVRRYAGRALRADTALWRDRRTLAPVLKSFAGARIVGALSGWRRRTDSTDIG